MKKKIGVSLAGLKLEMKPVMEVVEESFVGIAGVESCITSGTEWYKHKAGSLHFFGLALDYRIRHVKSNLKRNLIYKRIRFMLADISPRYQLVVEKTHIHIEYDPDA